MNQPSRRRFLVGSAVTIAGLTGVASADEDDESTLAALAASSVDSAVELIPAGDAIDEDYQAVVAISVEDDDSLEDLDFESRRVFEAVDGLEVEETSDVAVARPADFELSVGAATGSFDDPEPGEEIETEDGWRIAADDQRDLAFASDDGKVAYAGASDEDRREDAVEAAVDAAEDDGDGLLDDDAAETTFSRLGGDRFVYFLPDPETAFAPVAEDLTSLAAGFDQYPSEFEGTAENEYLLFPEDDADLGDDDLERIVQEIDPAQVVDWEAEREDDVIHLTVTAEAPPERDREAAPDARFETEIDNEEGTVTVEHVGGEGAPAESLELWLDGDLADVQFADEYDTVEEGDAITVETDPLAALALRWFDEEANAYYIYEQVAVGQDAFEVDYEFGDSDLEITYTGQREADPEKLIVNHVSERERSVVEEDFAAEYDALSAGDSIVIDGIEVGDNVSVALKTSAGPQSYQPTLVRFRASPPRMYLHRRDGTLMAYYRGDQERDADEFRVLVDGEAADVQFSDVQDSLTNGDEVELGEVEVGSKVVVEWTKPDEAVEVADLVVVPRTWAEMTYDESEGVLAVTHREGDAVAAEDLELRIDGEAADVQPDDEFDRFEQGDELRLEAPPLAAVELVWVGAEDEEHEHRIGRTITAEDSIEARYLPDEEAVELEYTGQREADPSRLGVRRGYSRGEPETPFADEYDTLTQGDTVLVEDVGAEERISVVLTAVEDDYRYSLLHFTPRPRWAFNFEDREGDVVLTYHGEAERDADGFRVLADGDATDVQPADEHDVLERGDEIVLGDFEVGTELVVEWTVPDDPVEVASHTVRPSAAFEFELEADESELEIEHAGGDAVDAEKLTVYLGHLDEPERPDAWSEEYDTVEEGDEITIELDDDEVEKLDVAAVLYDGRPLDHVEFDEESGDDAEGSSDGAGGSDAESGSDSASRSDSESDES